MLATGGFATPEPLYWQQEVFRHQRFFTGIRRGFDTGALRFAPCVKHITKSFFTSSRRVFDTRALRFAPCVKHITERANQKATNIYLTPGREYHMRSGRFSPAQATRSPLTGNKKVFDNRAPSLATGGFSTPEPLLPATGGFSTPEPLYWQRGRFSTLGPLH